MSEMFLPLLVEFVYLWQTTAPAVRKVRNELQTSHQIGLREQLEAFWL